MPRVFPAIRFEQSKRPMYGVILPAGYLTDHVQVDVYDSQLSAAGTVKGYQRRPSPDRARKIGKYVSKKGSVMPTSLLLNVRNRGDIIWHGSKKKGSSANGKLEIPDGTTVYMVDGQHRQLGFRDAMKKHPKLKDYLVSAVLMEGFKEEEEALQFYLLNTKAKKVPVDLSRRLIIERGLIQEIEEVKPWLLSGVRIAICLNTQGTGPWHGRIRPPNMAKQPYHMISENSFVSSLQYPLVSKAMKKKSLKKCKEYMAEYWKAMESIFGPSFARPQAHIIQKTSGVYSLHMLAPKVFEKLLRSRKKVNSTEISRLLAKWRNLPSDFWASSNDRGAKKFGTGITGFQSLARHLSSKAGL